MNATKILEEMIYETRKAEILQITWGGSDKIPVSKLIELLEIALEKIKSLPPSISEEDINKLQRYNERWDSDIMPNQIMEENEHGRM